MTTISVSPNGEVDDRPPMNQPRPSADSYLKEATERADAELVEGLREIDGAENVRWSIYNVGALKAGEDGFLVKWGTAQLSLENIAATFGAGTYKIRGAYPDGTYAGQRTVTISTRAIGVEQAKEKPATVSTPGVVQGQDIGSLMVMLDERQARREAERETRDRERREFWEKLALTLGPVLAPAILEFLKPKREGVSDLLVGLKGLRELEPANKGNPMKDALDMISTIRELDGDARRAGEKGPWDALTELARSAGPKLGESLQAIGAAMNGPNVGPRMLPPARIGVPAGTLNPLPATVMESASVLPVAGGSGDMMSSPSPTDPDRTSPISTQNPTNGEGMLLTLLPYMRQQLSFLVTKAAKNSDPGLYAELLLDNLPEGVPKGTVGQFLAREDWWSMLQQFDARVEPYQGWFSQLRESIMEEIQGDQNNEQPS